MSTVKIKTEPTTTVAAVDVQVKLEQHTSDIDTKLEPDSEADNEEEYIKSENDNDDSDDEDTDQDQFTIIPRNQQRVICEYPGCGRSINSAGDLRKHQREHKLHVELNIYGKTYTLTRQSLDDRWTCPIPDCNVTYKSVDGICGHTRKAHDETIGQQQQPLETQTRNTLYFLGVGNFYVNGVRCGYCNTIGVFLCHDCRLVPDCLLTHLQQIHGYNEKSIDDSALPDSAVNANADPNINQHASNPHLALAINQPYQNRHQDIIRGWLCVTSDCGYCWHAADRRSGHKKKMHQGEQLTTIPALVLRLVYAKPKASYFLITRIDQASGASTTSSTRMDEHKLDYNHNGLKDQDESENGDDASQNETTYASNQKKQWKCEFPDCERFCNSVNQLRVHSREHKLEVETSINGKTFTLSRQTLDDRWPCPVPDCEMTYKTIEIMRVHIRNAHSTAMAQKRVKIEDGDDQQQQQHQITKKTQRIINYLNVDDFYVCGVKYGHHATTGLFLCYECQSVPECLLTHLQQKHGYDGKSIDNSILPESARNSGSDPNGNQYTNNSHLAAAIRNPYQQQHEDIVQGWLCVAPNCGSCGSNSASRYRHQYTEHGGEQIIIVPALILRLVYAKVQSSYFSITRIDQASGAVAVSSNRVSQHKLYYNHSRLNAQDENGDDTNQKKQWKCELPECGRLFNSSTQISIHRREHKLESVVTVGGTAFTLRRQSSDDRWPCPIPGCESTYITIGGTHRHIFNAHSTSVKQKRAKIEDDDNQQQQQQQQQQQITKKRQKTIHYLNVDDFYVGGVKYGYHSATGLFICYECKLVPECLLTHLQQSHGLDEKSIDNGFLPDNARNNGSDPNINQHTSNPHLTAAIREPSQQKHPDITKGWLCDTSNCGYCYFTIKFKYQHHRKEHRGKQQSTVPALVLRLLFAKTQTSGFLIKRLDTIIDGNIEPINSTSQYKNECDDDDDDGDGLVLSDMGDEDDIH